MKQEDFERLKAVCEKEGFEIGGYTPSSRVFVIDKKDIWDGVEFLSVNGFDKIYKIKGISNDVIFVEPDMCFTKSVCKPSTEQAYIEQLKNECFERFGIIKDADKFIIEGCSPTSALPFEKDWIYFKEVDILQHYGATIYQQGKWATKLPERVEVKLTGHPTWTNNKSDGYYFCFHFKTINGGENLETHKAGQFLASCLEKYINGEIK